VAIWKAQVASGVRAYFKAVRNGNLVAGIPAGNFNCLLINPADTASIALPVTQSTQQAGTYYVDLPPAFLAIHGVGHYGLSLGIHKPAPTPVNDEVLLSVEVNVTDLDYIASDVLNLANGVETGWTPKEALRIILASVAGKTRDFQLNAPKFRDPGDTKDRITATQDANGNRTAVAYDKA